MKTLIHKARLLALVIAVTTPLAVSAQNLVTNGSFELGPFNPQPDGFEDDPPGDSSLLGWTVLGLTINRGTNDNPYGIKAADGVFLMDLTGHANVPPYGGVAQTIATVPTAHYYFSFDLGTYQDDPILSGPIAVSASAGTNSMLFTNNPTGSGNQWARFGFIFTADTNSTTISITGVDGKNYIGLDDVSVTQVTNFPSPTLRISALPVQLAWDTVPGAAYQVQYRPNLTTGDWLLLTTNAIIGTGSPVSITDTGAPDDGQRFYRLVITNAPGF